MNSVMTVTRWQFLAMLLMVSLSGLIMMVLLAVVVLDRVATVEAVVNEARGQVASHTIEAVEWRNRIERVEGQVKTLATKPSARPDAFTKPMGDVLEGRINALETALMQSQIGPLTGAHREGRDE